MRTLRDRTWSRVVAASLALLALAAAVLSTRARDPAQQFIAAANALPYRATEARFSEPFENRPFRATSNDALRLRDYAAQLQQKPELAREAGIALLVSGKPTDAETLLRAAVERCGGDVDVLAAIRRCADAKLLVDFSAASFQKNDRDLLLSFEAASRACQLAQTPNAAWNRALAAEGLGLVDLAARSWHDAVRLERSAAWSAEARKRERAASLHATQAPSVSAEGFFHRDLIARATAFLANATPSETSAEIHRAPDPVPADHLASDTMGSIAHLSVEDRSRAAEALASYTRGREHFENDRMSEAAAAFASAERDFRALHIPLALLARDQRIRAECTQSNPQCLDNIRAFHAELATIGRYPWLEARTAYAIGQTMSRRGRVHEAAQWLDRAQAAFHTLGDTASEGIMQTLLADVFTAAGEPDLALMHYLGGIRIRSEQMGDRRRRQFEDAAVFMLRHDYLFTAEALIDEMASVPATDSAKVVEATLRGTAYARRGDRERSAAAFAKAHALLDDVADPAIRADMAMFLAIAEAGSHADSPRPVMAQIDAAIAQHQHADQMIWLPPLLAERGAAYEHRNEPALAERDYLRAAELLEQREPRIDQTGVSIGVASESESPHDRAIRLYLRSGRIIDALSIEQRSTALRISSLYAPSLGMRDVYQNARTPLTGNSLAAIRRAMTPQQTAVVYHLLRDELITWVITHKEVFVVRRKARAENVARHVSTLCACVANEGCTDTRRVELLSDLFVRDWIERVPRDTTLLIQPPAELQSVPFSILKTRRGEMLWMRNPTATAPSLRAFTIASDSDAKRDGAPAPFFAAAAHPGAELAALPLATSEVTRASRFYPNAQVDIHAGRAHFLESARASSIVHFAGHVLINEEQPLLSALAFDGSELLYVNELSPESFARARLVVLSSCESGRSPRPTMSVANALLSQGVPSVVYTLWPVSDEAAQTFAVAFHSAIAAGLTRAEAVREAQRVLYRQQPDRASAWAAFALAGNPGDIMTEKSSTRPSQSMKGSAQ